MRLVCPNCGAQYAVDGNVIPEAGRDVQCSSCGHGWFQVPESEGGAKGDGENLSAAARIAGQPGPRRETTRIATGTPEPEADAAPERPARRGLDAAVMDVLREEAEREKAARAAEIPPMPEPEPEEPEPAPAPSLAPETEEPAPAAQTTEVAKPLPPEPDPATEPQGAPEPGPLPAPDERRIASETHKARMHGEHPAAAVATLSGRAAHRSEMLPDIEEINSTLRASADPSRTAEEAGAAAQAAEKKRSRRGFRLGFGLVALLALLAALIYTQGARITAAVPALEGPVTRYVAAIDKGRLWLDATLRGAGSE